VKTAAAVGVAAGVGLSVVLIAAVMSGDEAAPPPRAQHGPKLDISKLSQEVRDYRKSHPAAVDLLTDYVQPGAQAKTGVNVGRGKRPGNVTTSGGSWTLDAVTFEDGAASTYIEVKATNTGAEPARFVAMVDVP
jgi:hypothetical protein